MRTQRSVIWIVGLLLFPLLLWGWVSAFQDAARIVEPDIGAAVDMQLLYRFSGVSDDGLQGASTRKEATSVHCTNVAGTNTLVEVQLYQWNGTDVFTGTVNMPPNRSFTFSTQNTTIYFDDVLLGGSPGTAAIFQGSGQVWASQRDVICTAQVLDPLGYPPIFATELTLYTGDGILVGRPRPLFLPLLFR